MDIQMERISRVTLFVGFFFLSLAMLWAGGPGLPWILQSQSKGPDFFTYILFKYLMVRITCSQCCDSRQSMSMLWVFSSAHSTIHIKFKMYEFH